jgi:hypothetical protein
MAGSFLALVLRAQADPAPAGKGWALLGQAVVGWARRQAKLSRVQGVRVW